MAIRQATLLIRDKQTTGGALPAGALMAEPFVNLYDGILKFSGVTGGVFEPSDATNVFEVGSTLYNSKITNRLNINDNFIISGDTGQISTYDGITGAGLAGKFLSGITGGFVLGDISDIQGTSDITRVQGGTNINTGGTANAPVINLDDDIVLTSVNATNISGGTIYSAGTDLYDIFLTTGDLSGTSVSEGSNVSVNQVGTDYEVSVVESPSFNDINSSGNTFVNDLFANDITTATLTSTTIYSGVTDLSLVFQPIGVDSGSDTFVQGGTNISTGGTAGVPIINLDSDIILTSVEVTNLSATTLGDKRIVFAGPGGALIGDAGMTYASGTDVLTVNGNLTTNGTQYSGGTIIDDGVFTIDAATQVEVGSDLLPTSHLSYDIGAVGQRWDELYVKRIRLGTSTTMLEDNYFSSSTGTFLFDFADDLIIDNNVLPNADKVYDLGASGARWKTVYAQDFDLTGALAATGLTISNLTAGRVVYVGAGGELIDEASFEYNDSTNTLLADNISTSGAGSLTVGTGGVVIGAQGNGDLTVHGDLLVLGQGISGFTSDLYIEDNTIEINYNPTASTISTSLGAGWIIQDGSGIGGTDVVFDIRGASAGLANRSFATNVEDFRIRETGTISAPNGVRVIAELDIIDGGSY